jgi:Arc/MetJ family transcription regulator
MMQYLMQRRQDMRTTVTLDDKLLADAMEYTGISEKSALLNAALKSIIAREAGYRLAALGGSDPGATAGPRKRPWLE